MEAKKETEQHHEHAHTHEEAAAPAHPPNVKCSFCGNDALCDSCRKAPEEASKFEHMCYDCYQKMGKVVPENVRDRTHVIVPQDKLAEEFERFLDEMTQRAFMDLWNNEKKRLRELSKQDVAQAAYFEGARFMFGFMQRMSEEPSKAQKQEV